MDGITQLVGALAPKVFIDTQKDLYRFTAINNSSSLCNGELTTCYANDQLGFTNVTVPFYGTVDSIAAHTNDDRASIALINNELAMCVQAYEERTPSECIFTL